MGVVHNAKAGKYVAQRRRRRTVRRQPPQMPAPVTATAPQRGPRKGQVAAPATSLPLAARLVCPRDPDCYSHLGRLALRGCRRNAARSRSIAPTGAVVAGLLILLAACGNAPLDAVTLDPKSLTTDLVAHWTFDEGTGTVVGDHSGNQHDGTLTGGTWISTGRFGGALRLGHGDYVKVTGFPQATPNWTASVWTRSSAAQIQTETSEGETILSTENARAGGWQVHLDNRPGFNRFDAAYWAGSPDDYIVVFCNCVETDRWIHLTAVFDNTAKTLTLYQNATVVGQDALPTPIQAGDTTLYMGTWNMLTRFFTADIDDFAIWSRALGPAEISSLSSQPPGS